MARCATPHLQLPGEAVVVEASSVVVVTGATVVTGASVVAGSSVVVSSVGPEVVTVVPFEDNMHLKKFMINSIIL